MGRAVLIAGCVPALTLLAALGCGLVAGVFFAFSPFVMRALARLGAEQGIAAMQSINSAVLRSSFLAVFPGTAACVRDGYFIAGSLLYLVGTFGVTIGLNVPLNEELAGVDGASEPGAEVEALHGRVDAVESCADGCGARRVGGVHPGADAREGVSRPSRASQVQRPVSSSRTRLPPSMSPKRRARRTNSAR